LPPFQLFAAHNYPSASLRQIAWSGTEFNQICCVLLAFRQSEERSLHNPLTIVFGMVNIGAPDPPMFAKPVNKPPTVVLAVMQVVWVTWACGSYSTVALPPLLRFLAPQRRRRPAAPVLLYALLPNSPLQLCGCCHEDVHAVP
jgi:hypothetical protein